MLETFASHISLFYKGRDISLVYGEDLCCPQPQRPACTGLNTTRKRKSTLCATEADLEASREIQQILMSGQALIVTAVVAGVEPVSSKAELDRPVDTGSAFDPSLASPMKTSSVLPIFNRFDEGASEDPLPACSRRELKASNVGLPPVFSHSPPPSIDDLVRKLPVLGASRSRLPLWTREPPLTPPVRAHNPLPMNSPFSSREIAPEGAEFGLLSVSPPPYSEDEEERFTRRARVKFGRMHSPRDSVNNLNTLELDEESCPFDVGSSSASD